MKKLTTQAGVFGPYLVIEILADRYRCDGAELPFTVVGQGDVQDWIGPLPSNVPPLDRAAAAAEIDDVVADVYQRFTRFAIEYEEREAQAQAYATAGYVAPVPPRVAEFATPAGMAGQAAADLILAQAQQLRDAHAQLSALRMRKYEILRAADDGAARQALAEILTAIAAIAAGLA